MLNKISSKETVIAVIGMGYVGLSLLEVFGKEGFPIIGLDCDTEKVENLKKGESSMGFLPLDDLFPLIKSEKFIPTTDASVLKDADIIIVSVPTTLDEHKQPDFGPLRIVFKEVADYLKKGQLIILQSTTYPGTTEEEFLPLISGKYEVGKEVFLGYVPEISDIGNPNHTFRSVPRILSGVTPKCLELVEHLYKTIGCQTYCCSNTRVAEAAKIYQNTYRLVNVSFANEMKILFDRMGMDVWEVIEAAATKPFGFTRFDPSPGVGGDCIPIDPFYLTWKAMSTEGPSQMIDTAGHVNDMAPYFVVDKTIEGLGKARKAIVGSKVLLLGVAFKKDVDDPRHSCAIKVLELLKKKGAEVAYHDPFIPYLKEFNLNSVPFDRLGEFDAVVITTDHSQFDWSQVIKNSKLIIDTRHVVKGEKVVRA
ncbi:MAG: UDP-N-acetyl-D-glucosamine 6-dehydrogenase [Chlamydiales bacterium]|nr:UDP-N-acetyl-D-glucosamine 6-dehydrogenase [Chlamydiales bacterium]MCH9619309.1 UDP-N-acetyl-D-glucosamine 6-dehydrogenase [Chlamydiales bacterium]MCH9622571.1 UDP-N-acetyl-D-glucosamine 6-dehydrogenase [Chlamydiales bacterium]